jgi:polyisoprenoid-binding protein YceI
MLKSVLLTIETDSIDTNNEKRDAHLKSADFFNSDQYKQIKFESEIPKYIADSGELTGDLTVGDFKKRVTLKILPGGIVVDSYGQTKAGFNIETEINRKEFGLKWGAVTEAGGVIVSDMVKISADIQLIKQA